MGIVYTKQSLESLVRNFQRPIPLYDSDSVVTRKKIGMIYSLDLIEHCGGKSAHVDFYAKLNDGKEIHGRWA